MTLCIYVVHKHLNDVNFLSEHLVLARSKSTSSLALQCAKKHFQKSFPRLHAIPTTGNAR